MNTVPTAVGRARVPGLVALDIADTAVIPRVMGDGAAQPVIKPAASTTPDGSEVDAAQRITEKLSAGDLSDLDKATIIKLAARALTVYAHLGDLRITVEIGDPVGEWVPLELTTSGTGALLPYDARCLAGLLTAYADLAEADTASAARFAELDAVIQAGPQFPGRPTIAYPGGAR